MNISSKNCRWRQWGIVVTRKCSKLKEGKLLWHRKPLLSGIYLTKSLNSKQKTEVSSLTLHFVMSRLTREEISKLQRKKWLKKVIRMDKCQSISFLRFMKKELHSTNLKLEIRGSPTTDRPSIMGTTKSKRLRCHSSFSLNSFNSTTIIEAISNSSKLLVFHIQEEASQFITHESSAQQTTSHSSSLKW